MSEQDERLRDAFAQLLAMGAKGAVPAEAVWQQQGLNQFPQTPPVPGQFLDRSPTAGNFEPPGTVAPQRQFDLVDPTLDYPLAEAGAGLEHREFHPEDPRLKGAPAPFPGAKEIEVKPYDLPKKKKKKQKDKD